MGLELYPTVTMETLHQGVYFMCVCECVTERERKRERKWCMGKCRRGSRRCESLGRHPQHCTPPTPPCSRLEDSRKIKFHSNAICVCCAMIQLHWTGGFVLLMRRHRAECTLVIERSGSNKTPLYFFKVLNNGCLFPQMPIPAIECKSFSCFLLLEWRWFVPSFPRSTYVSFAGHSVFIHWFRNAWIVHS